MLLQKPPSVVSVVDVDQPHACSPNRSRFDPLVRTLRAALRSVTMRPGQEPRVTSCSKHKDAAVRYRYPRTVRTGTMQPEPLHEQNPLRAERFACGHAAPPDQPGARGAHRVA